MTSGPERFARFAYPPNTLGYCGPADAASVFGAAAEGEAALHDLRLLARQFEGAWPYLELIAGCNGFTDPLDQRVVDAYWIGNDLLNHVPAGALRASADERFGGRLGVSGDPIVGAAALGGVAHHSFHVFAVYPWLGLLRGGMGGPPLRVLDRCRIRLGRIVSVAGAVATVRTRALVFDGWRLVEGDSVLEQCHVATGETGWLSLEVNDLVACHWDWVCDHLTPAEALALTRCTTRNLKVVNALPVPGPVFAADRVGD